MVLSGTRLLNFNVEIKMRVEEIILNVLIKRLKDLWYIVIMFWTGHFFHIENKTEKFTKTQPVG